MKDKLRAIEDFDASIVGPILKGLEKFGEYRVMVLPDHPTPLAIKTHTSDPVPFALCTVGGKRTEWGSAKFSEKEAGETGLLVEDCETMIQEFFGRPEQVCDLGR